MSVCSFCHGCGYYENVALYYGRAECPVCEGTGQELVDTGECVRCGYCCTVASCIYGTWDAEKRQCTFLVDCEDGTTLCAKHDEIVALQGFVAAPAFGAGCSSTMFNERREKILKGRVDFS